MGNLDIGRKGWIGLGVQSAFDSPAAVADYTPFKTNELQEKHEPLEVDQGYGAREALQQNVPGKYWSEGDLEWVLDSKLSGYLLASALDAPNSASLGNGVYEHTFERVSGNDPTYLSAISDRVNDRQYYPNLGVDELEISVEDELATIKGAMLGDFPTTTTSGTLTTTSGSVFSFRHHNLSFGSSMAEAQGAANIKPHEFTLTVSNNAEVIFRHGQLGFPDKIVYKQFEIEAEATLYFEGTTQRDAYRNLTKRSMCAQFIGDEIGGGFRELLQINCYQTAITDAPLETGLDELYAESLTIKPEFDTALQKSINVVTRNRKASY